MYGNIQIRACENRGVGERREQKVRASCEKKVLTNAKAFVNIKFRAGSPARDEDLENNIQHYTKRYVCEEGPGQTGKRKLAISLLNLREIA